jgi:hypothetical protein
MSSNIKVLVNTLEKRLLDNDRKLDISLVDLAEQLMKFSKHQDKIYNIIEHFHEKNPQKFKTIDERLPYLGEFVGNNNEVCFDLVNIPERLVLILYELTIVLENATTERNKGKI